MTKKGDDGVKRRARQIQRSAMGVRGKWKYSYCLWIARQELEIERDWREKFRKLGYDDEQIAVGVREYRKENRERYEDDGIHTGPDPGPGTPGQA